MNFDERIALASGMTIGLVLSFFATEFASSAFGIIGGLFIGTSIGYVIGRSTK